MKIKAVFGNNEEIPSKYTADGKNVNPNLIISNIPENAESLVLIVDDPDAQRVAGFTWIHWVVFNIPVSEPVVIKENSIPGVPGSGTSNNKGYRGPSPPVESGVHHYYFKIYALDKMLDLKEGVKLEEVKKEMENHILEKTELVGLYSRN